MNQEPSVDKFPCAVCQVPCTLNCSRCFKVTYCSPAHQKEDWKTHKPYCSPHPVQLQVTCNESKLRSLVTTKKILRGQIIFRERSILSGPCREFGIETHGKEGPEKEMEMEHICLSCYKEIGVNPQYTCSTCQWPVCDLTCEKAKAHADFECKIFAEREIKPLLPLENEINRDGKNIYAMITTLRAILLRQFDPPKWKKILNNFSYPQIRAGSPYAQTHHKLTIEFIQKTCGLSDISDEIIERVSGILGMVTRGNNVSLQSNERHENKTAAYLFQDLSYIVRDANPNCQIVPIQLSPSEIEVQVIATRTIPVGDFIKQRMSPLSPRIMMYTYEGPGAPTRVAN